jgi:hypothetical protein
MLEPLGWVFMAIAGMAGAGLVACVVHGVS